MAVSLKQVIGLTYGETPDYLTAHVVMETYDGDTAEVDCHIYKETDPNGINPEIKAFLEANPDFPIAAYVPPTPEQKRAGVPDLNRLDFRTRSKEIGITTAVINSYLASITDADHQDDMTIYWEAAQFFSRLAPFVVEVTAFAGKTPEQMDGVFFIAP